MHKSILFSTFGSSGDLFPYLAIASQMQARGHTVAIASGAYHRERVKQSGMAFYATAPACDFTDPAFQQRAMHPRTGGKFVLRDLLLPQIRASYGDLLQAVDGVDLLVTQMLSYAGPLVAETTGIPWVSTTLAPVSFFSYADSPVLAPSLRPIRECAPWLNAAVNRVARYTTRSWSEPVRRFRQELRMRPPADPLFEGQHSPARVLALFSSHFAARQPDWPRQVLHTGFPFWRHPPMPDDLSLALSRFLEGGPAPIVFTLGSSAVLDPGAFYRESLEAARQLGLRAILLGASPCTTVSAEGDALSLPYAPHSHVFPRACAVVHPGGIGTSAEALRCGCPMLVVPWAYDQPDNAARLVRLRVGRTMARNTYTARRAAAALEKLLVDPGYRSACSRLADQIQSENGVEAACDALEGFLQ